MSKKHFIRKYSLGYLLTCFFVFLMYGCNETSPDAKTDGAIYSFNDSLSAHTKTDSNKKNESTPPVEPVVIPDSIPIIEADYFSVKDEILKRSLQRDTVTDASGNPVYANDWVWVRDSSTGNVLQHELYTDGFRVYAMLYNQKNIPSGLYPLMGFSTAGGDLVSVNQRKVALPFFIQRAKCIEPYFFISANGFQLGDPVSKATRRYGKPDAISKEAGYTVYHWKFTGEMTWTDAKPKPDLKGKPLVADSFGHEVTMYFIGNKLAALVLFNDIP